MTEQLITKVVDGVNPTIEASVVPLGMKNAVSVEILDGAGGQITNFGGVTPTILYVDEANLTTTYLGEALPGTATSAASWRISVVDTSSGTRILFADSVSTFTKVWDDRATYTYG